MKTRFAFLLPALALSFAALQAADKTSAWTTMFNGKDLTGWKANDETPNVFKVEDGVLKVDGGGRAHLFYEADGAASFKTFEFKAKVTTTAGSNAGI